MIEDVNLMAEFMGITKGICIVCNGTKDRTFQGHPMYCLLCDSEGFVEGNYPDYPNDMNALLGVMDKLENIHNIITDISGDHHSVVIWERGGYAREILSVDFSGYTGLPSILFQGLVKCIRLIPQTGIHVLENNCDKRCEKDPDAIGEYDCSYCPGREKPRNLLVEAIKQIKESE